METEDPQDDVAELEERLEGLTQSLERSRKVLMAARIAAFAGGIWLVASFAGLLGFEPVGALVAGAAVLVGIVLLGSTRTTARQTAAEIADVERLRAELIDRMELRTVADGSDRGH